MKLFRLGSRKKNRSKTYVAIKHNEIHQSTEPRHYITSRLPRSRKVNFRHHQNKTQNSIIFFSLLSLSHCFSLNFLISKQKTKYSTISFNIFFVKKRKRILSLIWLYFTLYNLNVNSLVLRLLFHPLPSCSSTLVFIIHNNLTGSQKKRSMIS